MSRQKESFLLRMKEIRFQSNYPTYTNTQKYRLYTQKKEGKNETEKEK